MATDDNPLKNLIIEENQNLDLQLLTDLLAGRVAFTSDREMQFMPAFHDASNQQKILLVLLGTKAKSILFEGETDGLAPSEAIELDIMPGGSVKSTLKSLLEDTHEVKKNSDKRYYVPNYIIPKLSGRLAKEVK